MNHVDGVPVQPVEQAGGSRVWCSCCSAPLPDTGGPRVAECPNCGVAVDWDAATKRSRAWTLLQQAEEEHREAQHRVTAASARLATARQDATAAYWARQSAQESWDALQRAARRATPPAPQPAPVAAPATPDADLAAQSMWQPGVAGPAAPWTPRPDYPTSPPAGPPSPAPRTGSAGIPLAVLLQGTGAVLLLAALTTASAVLWETMPEALQALTLLAAVALVGAVTVVARPLPATSVILAVLTAASGAVVASSLPQITPELDARWYPPVASAVGAACLLAAGRMNRVSFWWRGGWVALGLAGVLTAAAIAGAAPFDPGTAPWFGLATVSLAAVAAVLIAVSVALRPREPEAAITSLWTALAIATLAVVSALAGYGTWLVDLDAATAQDPAWVAASFLALAALSGAAYAAAWLTDGSPAAWLLGASGGFLAVLPTLTLGAVQVASGWSAIVAVAPTAATAAGLVWAAWRWRGHPWLPGAAATAGAVLVGSAALLNLVVLAEDSPPTFAWLMATLTALAVAAAMWSYGVMTNRGGWVGAGLIIGSAAWFAAWAAGHLGGAIEVVTLSVLAAVIGTWFLGVRLDLWQLRRAPAVLPQLAILACLFPTVAISVTAVADGAPDGPRLLLLAGGLAGVGALAAWWRTGATLTAVAAALAGVAHAWVAVNDPALEWFSLTAAAGVALVLAAGVADRWATPRAATVAVLVVAFVPSAVALLIDPTPVAGRLALVAVVAALVTALGWRWPFVAWAAATLALAAGLRVYTAWAEPSVQAPGEGWPPPEVLTLPAALALGISAALASRLWGSGRAVSVGATVAATAGAVPTAVLVATDPLVEQWDTAARVLVLLAAAGLLAVLLDAVAPIRSGVAATTVVVLPLALYSSWLAEQPAVVLEAASGPLALAGALVLGWIRRPATLPQWWLMAVRPAAFVLLVVSTVWAVTAPIAGAEPSHWVRIALVAAVWIAAAVLLRQRPPLAAGSAALGVLVVWANGMYAVARIDEPVLEAVTWPTAVALAAWCALGAWAAGIRHNSWLVAAGPIALAVVPTAALAWQDGEVGWRVWFGLVVGGLLVAVGAWREWAGFVYPGLVALALVTVPVLVQLAQDLPGWVPLTLVGLALLALGARLEAARRRGGQLRHWVAHLH